MKDEKDFAQRLRRRDPEAWACLYDEYFNRIYKYIVFRVGNRTDSEDLTEQVFLKALESSQSFRWRGAPVASWLFRIAHNQIVDHWRANKSRNTLALDESLESDEDTPDEVAEMNSDIRQLVDAVKRLTHAQQEVIELRFAGELSVAEVSILLGKSQGAVKVMQHTALTSLRKMLTSEEEQP